MAWPKPALACHSLITGWHGGRGKKTGVSVCGRLPAVRMRAAAGWMGRAS
jgi:hypothetical protein